MFDLKNEDINKIKNLKFIHISTLPVDKEGYYDYSVMEKDEVVYFDKGFSEFSWYKSWVQMSYGEKVIEVETYSREFLYYLEQNNIKINNDHKKLPFEIHSECVLKDCLKRMKINSKKTEKMIKNLCIESMKENLLNNAYEEKINMILEEYYDLIKEEVEKNPNIKKIEDLNRYEGYEIISRHEKVPTSIKEFILEYFKDE
jgi:hypothetical protein